jgi:hypothetical protein
LQPPSPSGVTAGFARDRSAHRRCARSATVKSGGPPTSLRSVSAGSSGTSATKYVERRGSLWLNVIAVNADTWRPGDSFLPLGLRSDVTKSECGAEWSCRSSRATGRPCRCRPVPTRCRSDGSVAPDSATRVVWALPSMESITMSSGPIRHFWRTLGARGGWIRYDAKRSESFARSAFAMPTSDATVTLTVPASTA